MNGVLSRWNTLSRAMQWALLALVGIGVFFAVVDPVSKWAAQLNAQSNLKAEALKDIRAQAKIRSDATAELKRNARLYGQVLPPEKLDDRVQAASQRIDEVLRQNGANEVVFGARSPVSLGSRVLPGYVDDPEKEELRRVTFDVAFTGTPERVIEIVAALEQIPEITLIADIRLTRIDSRGARLVEAQLSPVVWGIARKGGRN